MKPLIDLGCGPRKASGAVGVDKIDQPGVDVVWDLDKMPYPFEDNSFQEALLSHSLEHFDDPLAVLQEVARIVVPGGHITIRTPHFSSMNAYSDLTHKHAFSLHAFHILPIFQNAEEQPIQLKLINQKLTFWRLHDAFPLVPAHIFGVSLIARFFPILYERFFSFLFTANEIHVTLQLEKPAHVE